MKTTGEKDWHTIIGNDKMARGRANPYHKQLQTGRLIEKIRKDSEPM